MKVGKGKRWIYFEKAPVYSSSVTRCGQPTTMIVPVELRQAAAFERSSLKWPPVEVCDLAFVIS